MDLYNANAVIMGSGLSGVAVTGCKPNKMAVDGFNVCELIEFCKNNHKEN